MSPEPVTAEERATIVLDDEEAARFLDALDHPERFEPGLRRLVERPSILPVEGFSEPCAARRSRRSNP